MISKIRVAAWEPFVTLSPNNSYNSNMMKGSGLDLHDASIPVVYAMNMMNMQYGNSKRLINKVYLRTRVITENLSRNTEVLAIAMWNIGTLTDLVNPGDVREGVTY